MTGMKAQNAIGLALHLFGWALFVNHPVGAAGIVRANFPLPLDDLDLDMIAKGVDP